MMGFEPTTFGTTIRRSNQLNYNHHVFAGANIIFYFFEFQKILNNYILYRTLQKGRFEQHPKKKLNFKKAKLQPFRFFFVIKIESKQIGTLRGDT